MTRKIGARVGAMLGGNAKDKVIRFLDYGVYLGDEVPPAEIGGFNMGMPNPKIQLDNGKVVWGCECWWGAEATFKEKLCHWEAAGYTIETIDIDAARAAAASPPPEPAPEPSRV